MSRGHKARRSQLVSTFGVGGLFPSENESFMVAGLHEWEPDRGEPAPEPRLARSLGVSRLVQPPAGRTRDVPIIRFPRTQTCPNCHRLGTAQELGGGFKESFCRKCKPQKPLTPSRLVVACRRGHIDDFPYFSWLHAGAGMKHASADEMRLEARGRTSSLADMVLTCTCGAPSIGLDGAFEAGALAGIASCKGSRPWLGGDAAEQCSETLTTLQRGASNVWFPAVRSSISIPPFSEAVAKFVDREWALLQDPAVLGIAAVLDGLVRKSHGHLTAEEIVAEARRRHEASESSEEVTEESLRRDEYKALIAGKEEHGTSDFVCLEEEVPDELADVVAAVRKVTRLREVRALYGFSRLAPTNNPADANFCSLSPESVGWLPAVEVIGEGVFFDLEPKRITQWAETYFAQRRQVLLQAARDRADDAAGRDRAAEPVNVAEVMLHTFAHVLIDQFALDAGYPAASIRERLFVGKDMAGLLLYTATSDSAGSLGGLAAQAQPERLRQAVMAGLERLSWCSSDPVCIESVGSGTDGLNLAACHSCVLVPETSCEKQNSYLDRGLLFGTPRHPQGGFFTFSAETNDPRSGMSSEWAAMQATSISGAEREVLRLLANAGAPLPVQGFELPDGTPADLAWPDRRIAIFSRPVQEEAPGWRSFDLNGTDVSDRVLIALAQADEQA